MVELLSIPAIVTAVEAVKWAGLPTRFAPLTAILLGAAFGYGIGDIVPGIVIGLSASGLYSGVKTVLKS